MDTADQGLAGAPESTTPEAIAALGVDVQVLYQRVSMRLGLGSPEHPAIGRYRVKSKLGEGGMGVVYLADDPQLEREVAIKLVSTRPFVDADKLRARLLREAQLLAKLRHPNVVTVHDTGEHRGEVFLAMEYVAGESLREWQAHPGRTRAELLSLYVEAGHGLAAAHAQSIVHRDFKPDNVFVTTDGHALVGDFGLANLIAESQPGATASDDPAQGSNPKPSRMTLTGELLGTVGYMAPEQLRGDAIDERTDQYAFCVSLWEATTGVRPFDASTREALLESMNAGAEPRGGEGLATWLRRALTVGLAPEPGDRHPSMVVLVAALERGISRRDRWVLGGVLGGALTLALAGVVSLSMSQPAAAIECPLVDEIARVQANEAWPEFQTKLGDDAAGRLATNLAWLDDRAAQACKQGDQAEIQTLARWVRHLDGVVSRAHEYEHSRLREIVDAIDRDRFNSPPPEPLSEATNTLLEHISVLEDDDELTQIIATIDPLLRRGDLSNVDRMELGFRLGRAYMYHGEFDDALRELRAVRHAAGSVDYRDMLIRVHLQLAKTMLMRVGDFAWGREYLSYADSDLTLAKEPLLSPRRSDYLELSASLAYGEGEFDAAVRIQRRVLLRSALTGTDIERVAAIINLGAFQEIRGNEEVAESCYRGALALAPGDPEAALNLARVLANREPTATARGEALALLDLVVRSERLDLHVLARAVRLQLAIAGADAQPIIRRRTELVEALRTDESVTPPHRIQAWALVASAHAVLGDIGGGYEAAIAELGDIADAGLLITEIELDGATAAAENHPIVARELAIRAFERLNCCLISTLRIG